MIVIIMFIIVMFTIIICIIIMCIIIMSSSSSPCVSFIIIIIIIDMLLITVLGFLKVTTIAIGDGGAKVRSEIYFPTDPGYRDTARMLVESGLVLALQLDKIKVGGGVYTPAACQVLMS